MYVFPSAGGWAIDLRNGEEIAAGGCAGGRVASQSVVNSTERGLALRGVAHCPLIGGTAAESQPRRAVFRAVEAIHACSSAVSTYDLCSTPPVSRDNAVSQCFSVNHLQVFFFGFF